MASGLLVVSTASTAFTGVLGGVFCSSWFGRSFWVGGFFPGDAVRVFLPVRLHGHVGGRCPFWLGWSFLVGGFFPGDVVCVFLPVRLDGFLLGLPLPTFDGTWVEWGAFASFHSPGLPGLSGAGAWA